MEREEKVEILVKKTNDINLLASNMKKNVKDLNFIIKIIKKRQFKLEDKLIGEV